MIAIVFGGKAGDSAFELWVKERYPHVLRFSALKQGDLSKFAFAVTESCNVIVKKDYHGTAVEKRLANDPMLVHIQENELEEAQEKLDRIKSFLILAKDSGLEATSSSYNSELGDLLAKALW